MTSTESFAGHASLQVSMNIGAGIIVTADTEAQSLHIISCSALHMSKILNQKSGNLSGEIISATHWMHIDVVISSSCEHVSTELAKSCVILDNFIQF